MYTKEFIMVTNAWTYPPTKEETGKIFKDRDIKVVVHL
jgi:hypothetical protein